MSSYVNVKFEKKRREKQNCEISHIDRTNKPLTIYKVEQKLLSLCLCVEHREFKVT